MTIIYGIDTTKPYTAIQVRDAVVECFYSAHKEVLEMMSKLLSNPEPEKSETSRHLEVREFIRDFFNKTGEDFEKPTKKSIMKVCDMLAKFAAFFRSQDIIKKHYGEIMQLLDNLPADEKQI